MSDFILRKNVILFYQHDIDKDGLVERADFVEGAKKAAAVLGLEDYQSLVAAYEGIWSAYWSHADSNGDGVVSLMEWLSAQQAMAGQDPQALRAAHNQTINVLFRTIDASGDGVITPLEYRAWVSGWLTNSSDADAAFHRIDTDEDGRISVDEMADLLWDYHTSTDPSAPGNWVYGGH